jgi:hypothetical protein
LAGSSKLAVQQQGHLVGWPQYLKRPSKLSITLSGIPVDIDHLNHSLEGRFTQGVKLRMSRLAAICDVRE